MALQATGGCSRPIRRMFRSLPADNDESVRLSVTAICQIPYCIEPISGRTYNSYNTQRLGGCGTPRHGDVGARTDGPSDYQLEPSQPADRHPGRAGLDWLRHPLGDEPECRGLSRSDAALVEVITQNPAPAPRRWSDWSAYRSRPPQRHAGARVPAKHVGCRPERHQVPVRLRDRLLGSPPGGHQPHRVRRPA